MDVKWFLAFIVKVISHAAEMQGRSERIKMVQDAARRFLKGVDKSGEDVDQGSQTFTPGGKNT